MSTQFAGRITPVMQRILDALNEHGDMDSHDLAEAACTCYNTLSGGGYLKKMECLGLVRIAKWKRNSPGAPTPIYSASDGESVKPPPAYSCSKRTKRWRQKIGYRGDEWARRQALKTLATITRRHA